jgi:hypothetical protein
MDIVLEAILGLVEGKGGGKGNFTYIVSLGVAKCQQLAIPIFGRWRMQPPNQGLPLSQKKSIASSPTIASKKIGRD